MKTKRMIRITIVILVPLFILSLLVLLGKTLITRHEQKKEDETIKIALTGDFLWEQNFYDTHKGYKFGSYFDQVKPYLDSDLTIANQEVPIGGKELGVSGTAFTYNAPEEIAQQFPGIGIDYVTLANNHMLDMGVSGIENTLDFLDEAGLKHTGAYRNKEESEKISVVNVKGVKIAILSYTYDTNVGRNSNHVNYFLSSSGTFDKEYQEKLKKDIQKAKKKADMVFVSMHWGKEFTYELTDTQKEVAKFLNEQSVDLVIGNHPHNIQPATTLTNKEGKETIVFYSLGNTTSASAAVKRASTDFQNMYEIGALVNLNIVKTDQGYVFENVKVIPIVNHFEYDHKNFKIIPFKEYTSKQAKKHFRAQFEDNFNKKWLEKEIRTIFDDSGFLDLD